MKKTCIVTGANGEIGKKIVKKFSDNNYDVISIDVCKQNNCDKAFYCCDITSEENVLDVINSISKKYKKIDVLVNTAGICGKYNTTVNYSFDNFKKIYEVNVFGTFLMIKNILPLMIKENHGSIINFGSVSGMRGYNYEIGYGSSKWAVIGMTKNVANEYGKYGIRVNSISPGWVETDMMKKTLNDYNSLNKNEINLGPFNRAASPEEIANAVYFLCSDEASYITGHNLVVDGGMLLD